MPADRLDPVIHPIPRLAICAALDGMGWVDFAAVRDAAALSDSALSKNARALEAAGYLEMRKGYVGRRPRTWLRLTKAGAAAFAAHLASLTQFAQRRA